MKTQQDSKIRVVALENLKAMCAYISGMCHRYSVVKVSRSRVHVEYSNPDEYGGEQPIVAVFPCYPSGWSDDDENPRVTLDMRRCIGDADGYGYQAFDVLLDCPTLWRDSGYSGKSERWRSHRQIRADGDDKGTTDRDTCVVCDSEGAK